MTATATTPVGTEHPHMVRAAGLTEFGGPGVLRLLDIEEPEAGPGEVRVRVRAAGVQPADLWVRRNGGIARGTTGATQWPVIPGNEFAGVIDGLGEGVTGFALGDEVLGFRVLNCYAESVVAPADQVVRKPGEVPWRIAGALSASGQTAHTALERLGVDKGDTVLVHAAAGGVGTITVQLAALRGATVIGTASVGNHDYLRWLGAVPVTYGPGLVDRVRAVAPHGVDAALDAIGGDALTDSLHLVADSVRVGTLVDHEAAPRLGVQALRTNRSAERLVELVELVAAGQLTVTVSKLYPLARAADAHRHVETGHARGKVVLTTGLG